MMTGGTVKSESEHILELSAELLDDIELSRLDSEKLLLKCNRLARLAGSDEERKWIAFEIGGYNSTDPVSIAYMYKTGRWVDVEKKTGYWGPLAQQEATISAKTAQLAASALTSLSGDYMLVTMKQNRESQSAISNIIMKLSGVKGRVLGLLHSFVSKVYYERVFANLAETTFQRYKRDVDALIAEKAGDVLTKIPSVISRLQEGDPEGVIQALATCRRIVDNFADAIYPPTDATLKVGDNIVKLDAGKHLNRINAYIADHTESTSRRVKLRQNLSNLYDRVSTGVHKEVTSEEAFALFLNVYLFLGEVLHLDKAVEHDAVVEGQTAG